MARAPVFVGAIGDDIIGESFAWRFRAGRTGCTGGGFDTGSKNVPHWMPLPPMSRNRQPSTLSCVPGSRSSPAEASVRSGSVRSGVSGVADRDGGGQAADPRHSYRGRGGMRFPSGATCRLSSRNIPACKGRDRSATGGARRCVRGDAFELNVEGGWSGCLRCIAFPMPALHDGRAMSSGAANSKMRRNLVHSPG
jgi:hypothetical protein